MILYLFFKAARRLCLRLPLKICYGIAVFSADIYRLFAREDRRHLRDNLKVILGTDDKKIIKRHIRNIFRNFAKYLVDFFRFSKLSRDYIMSYITIEGKENVDKAMAKARGAVMLAAHIGNWEMGAAAVSSLGYPLYAIVLDHKNQRVNGFFRHQRSLTGVKAISIGAELKTCFKVLGGNNLLAIVGDRNFSGRGVTVNFFGRPAALPRGPAFFSLRMGAPIIPTFLVRMPGDRFKLIFGKPIESESTGDKKEDIKNTMERYAPAIEKYIKEFPDQWYAFRRVWE